jgi:hypothetical protein
MRRTWAYIDLPCLIGYLSVHGKQALSDIMKNATWHGLSTTPRNGRTKSWQWNLCACYRDVNFIGCLESSACDLGRSTQLGAQIITWTLDCTFPFHDRSENNQICLLVCSLSNPILLHVWHIITSPLCEAGMWSAWKTKGPEITGTGMVPDELVQRIQSIFRLTERAYYLDRNNKSLYRRWVML